VGVDVFLSGALAVHPFIALGCGICCSQPLATLFPSATLATTVPVLLLLLLLLLSVSVGICVICDTLMVWMLISFVHCI